jgi:hypothetical protein
MLAYDAARGRAQQSVVAGNMARDTADGGTLGTTLCLRGPGDGHERCGQRDDEKMSFHDDPLG